jgi:hypothetical protein
MGAPSAGKAAAADPFSSFVPFATDKHVKTLAEQQQQAAHHPPPLTPALAPTPARPTPQPTPQAVPLRPAPAAVRPSAPPAATPARASGDAFGDLLGGAGMDLGKKTGPSPPGRAHGRHTDVREADYGSGWGYDRSAATTGTAVRPAVPLGGSKGPGMGTATSAAAWDFTVLEGSVPATRAPAATPAAAASDDLLGDLGLPTSRPAASADSLAFLAAPKPTAAAAKSAASVDDMGLFSTPAPVQAPAGLVSGDDLDLDFFSAPKAKLAPAPAPAPAPSIPSLPNPPRVTSPPAPPTMAAAAEPRVSGPPVMPPRPAAAPAAAPVARPLAARNDDEEQDGEDDDAGAGDGRYDDVSTYRAVGRSSVTRPSEPARGAADASASATAAASGMFGMLKSAATKARCDHHASGRSPVARVAACADPREEPMCGAAVGEGQGGRICGEKDGGRVDPGRQPQPRASCKGPCMHTHAQACGMLNPAAACVGLRRSTWCVSWWIWALIRSAHATRLLPTTTR